MNRDKEEDHGFSKSGALLCSDLLAASAMVQAGSNDASYCWQQDRVGLRLSTILECLGLKRDTLQ